jgi:hypothetical protein
MPIAVSMTIYLLSGLLVKRFAEISTDISKMYRFSIYSCAVVITLCTMVALFIPSIPSAEDTNVLYPKIVVVFQGLLLGTLLGVIPRLPMRTYPE